MSDALQRLDQALTVRVRFPDQARAVLINPQGVQVNRKLHAALFWTREEADHCAALCRDFCPSGTVVKVGRL